MEMVRAGQAERYAYWTPSAATGAPGLGIGDHDVRPHEVFSTASNSSGTSGARGRYLFLIGL